MVTPSRLGIDSKQLKNKQSTISCLLAVSRVAEAPWRLRHHRSEGQLLSYHNSDRIDKEIILSSVLKCKRVDLYKEPEKIVTLPEQRRFRNLLQKYKQGCPVAYLTGHKEFMSLDFIITKDVLIPRPETELLVEETLKCIGFILKVHPEGHKTKITILDIGTGSGNIAISIAKHCSSKKLQILASDISKKALKIASLNARRHRVQKQIRFYYGDLFKAFNNLSLANHATGRSASGGQFDIIISNPPYIADKDFYKLPINIRKYEPQIALFSGPDGLCFIRKIISQALYYLKPQGYLLLELGLGQSKKVLNLIKSTNNFEDIKILSDYNKIPRVLCARRI